MYLLAAIAMPVLLYFSLPILLVDPRIPSDKPNSIVLWVYIGLISLPAFLSWAPDSGLYNASLALGMSLLLTPMIFSTMRTDDFGEIARDIIFLIVVRTVFAAVLAIPLTWFASWWFIILGAIAIFSFYTRMYLWIPANGDASRYLVAILCCALILSIYFVLVDQSEVSPHTWSRWRDFLPD